MNIWAALLRQPVLVGLGAAALGELIPLNVIVGMLIVLAGVALARRRATLLQNTR